MTTFSASGGIVSRDEACSVTKAKAARLAAVGLGMVAKAVLRRGGWREYSMRSGGARLQRGLVAWSCSEYARCEMQF